jgi:hypothetical protein
MTKLIVAFRNFAKGRKSNSRGNTVSEERPVQRLATTDSA